MATAVVVTGASRGFGRAAAIGFTAELVRQQKAKRVDVYLWARDESKLKETQQAVETAPEPYGTEIRVATAGVDLADQASYVGHVDALVDKLKHHEPAYESIYVIHNAGSVGALGGAHTWPSASELASYWELNLNHVCFFNARLLHAFHGDKEAARLVLVNVSSNVAVTPFGGCGLYCTAKAGREMHFRVVAEETKGDGDRVRVVNYWPGALDTAMQDELRDSPAFQDAIHQVFVGFKEQGQLASAEDSALFCAQAVVADAFETGATLAYDPTKV